MAEFDFTRYVEARRAELETALGQILPPEDAPPPVIHQAMRYAVFAGGKRLRPILVLAGCEAAGAGRARSLPFACAVECVHTYSLVHDDLPALDNDDLRRGRATLHRAFDEATAILAGDALLTFAIDAALARGAAPGFLAGRLLGSASSGRVQGTSPNPARRSDPGAEQDRAGASGGNSTLDRPRDADGAIDRPLGLRDAGPPEKSGRSPAANGGAGGACYANGWVRGDSEPTCEDDATDADRFRALRVLVAAIGTHGMIGGQVADLLATGVAVDEATVRSIHARKTGALLRACPVIGGILAGAPDETLALLDSYGADLGLAFQIIDDILDIEGTPTVLGKSVGKDAACGKATFPAAIGVEASRQLAGDLAERAARTAGAIGPAARPLVAIVEYAVRRER